MKASLIQIALLVASVAANPTPDAAPDAASGIEVEVRGLETRDASGLHERSALHKRNGWLYCGITASEFLLAWCTS